MSDESDEEIVTAIDILEQEKIIEEEASALFGDFDNNICTYEKEYMKRQPLYSCLTCKSLSGQPAGICLACSLNCHDGHNLIELYTKRLFRCDCGNKKFKDNQCILFNVKDEYNCQNIYNQNFDGLYCTCKRPYPDDENDNIDEEMIQCILCEDWYHSNHLDVASDNIPDPKAYSEFICFKCSKDHPFLYSYNYQVNNVVLNAQENSELISLEKNLCLYIELEKRLNVMNQNIRDQSTLIIANEKSDTKNLKSTSNEQVVPSKGPLFWPNEKWRDALCRCKECMNNYKTLNIEFIIDPQDTLAYFTKKRLATTDAPANEDSSSTCESQYEKGLAAFSTLNKVAQNEMLHQFNSMKENFKDYLKDFVTTGKVVKKDDILEFFEREAKRPKFDSGIPPTCR